MPSKVSALQALAKAISDQTVFTEPVFHYSGSIEPFDQFDFSLDRGHSSILDLIGAHVAPDPATSRGLYENVGWPDGFTMPLMANVSRPYYKDDGEVFWESELADHLDEMMSEFSTDRALRQHLGKDYTHIPYINEVDLLGSDSYIMLPSPESGADTTPHLRSIFANYDNLTSPNLYD